jgi:hypothetical protein
MFKRTLRNALAVRKPVAQTTAAPTKSEQAAMDAFAAMRSSKEGQARDAAADAEKTAMLAKRAGSSAPIPSAPMQKSPTSTLTEQQIDMAKKQQTAPKTPGKDVGLFGASALAQANQSMSPMGGYGGGGFKKGGSVGKASKASKASSRGDGIAQRGKTKGRMI